MPFLKRQDLFLAVLQVHNKFYFRRSATKMSALRQTAAKSLVLLGSDATDEEGSTANIKIGYYITQIFMCVLLMTLISATEKMTEQLF